MCVNKHYYNHLKDLVKLNNELSIMNLLRMLGNFIFVFSHKRMGSNIICKSIHPKCTHFEEKGGKGKRSEKKSNLYQVIMK